MVMKYLLQILPIEFSITLEAANDVINVSNSLVSKSVSDNSAPFGLINFLIDFMFLRDDNALQILSTNPAIVDRAYDKIKDKDLEKFDFEKEKYRILNGEEQSIEYEMCLMLKELRKEKQLTQKELGEKLNITDKAISKWERGLSFPDIAEFFEIDISELLNGERGKKQEIDIEKAIQEAIENYKNIEEKKKEKVQKVKKRIGVI